MNLALGSTVALGRRGGLGDMVVCLPLVATIKRQRPDIRVCMVASPYTAPLLESCEWVDEVIEDRAVLERPALLRERGVKAFLNPLADVELARAAYLARVPVRIGDLDRPATVRWCNRFVWGRRKWSALHEAQLILRHLKPLGLGCRLPLSELKVLTRLSRVTPLEEGLRSRLDGDFFNLVIHPKSMKNGREWPAGHFLRLVQLLEGERIRILLTGVEGELRRLAAECPELLAHRQVMVLMGATCPQQLIALIANADGLVASGTGPLHLAAALGIHALGLFPRRASMDARRWYPLGTKGEALQMAGSCNSQLRGCDDGAGRRPCLCMEGITPERVAARVRSWVRECAAERRMPLVA